MEELLKRLESWGCDIPEALERLLDDQELLIDCIQQVAQDPAFDVLGASLKKGDAKTAFEAAHTLKGIIANTGITPLYTIIVEIVEPLRKGNAEGQLSLYKELMDKKKELDKILSTY